MNDLDTRIRDTLERVAQTASAPSRLEELTSRRPRRVPAVALAAVAVVAIAITPILLLGGESPRAPSFGAPGDDPVDIDPSWLVAEPEDVAAIIAATPDELPDGSQVPGTPGTRPPLRSESTWCMLGLPEQPWSAAVLPIPLDLAVTEGALIESCLLRSPEVEAAIDAPTDYTVCRAYYLDRKALDSASSMILPEIIVVAGDTSTPGPGIPVIFGRATDCTSESLPRMGLDDGFRFDELNRGRDLEIAVLGASLRNCFSVDEARALAAAVHTELGAGWLLVDVPWAVTTMEDRFGGPVDESTGREDCHGPAFDFAFGFVAQPTLTPRPPTAPATVTTLSPDEVEG
jgi:hypothetical protein